MKQWRVEWTPRAQQDADKIASWWAKNRGGLPELLQHELAQATEGILATPGIGTPHHARAYPRLVRRLVLPKTGYLVFYAVDEPARRIDILRLWSSLRRKAPHF